MPASCAPPPTVSVLFFKDYEVMIQASDGRGGHTQGRSANMGQAEHKRRAVLVVEDDAELRAVTVALLEDGDVDAIECESAEAALADETPLGGPSVMLVQDQPRC